MFRGLFLGLVASSMAIAGCASTPCLQKVKRRCVSTPNTQAIPTMLQRRPTLQSREVYARTMVPYATCKPAADSVREQWAHQCRGQVSVYITRNENSDLRQRVTDRKRASRFSVFTETPHTYQEQCNGNTRCWAYGKATCE